MSVMKARVAVRRCRLLFNYRNGRTRIGCRSHPYFQTRWLPNMEAIHAAETHKRTEGN